MADLNYLDPKSPLQKIAEKLDGEPTTQVDPDSLMSRIATAVEDGAGGGGGYSVETVEDVLFDDTVSIVYSADDDGWFLSGEHTLSKQLDEAPDEIVVSLNGFIETYSKHYISSSEWSYESSDENKMLHIIYLDGGDKYFSWEGCDLDAEKADFDANMKLYTLEEKVAVTNDFAKAVNKVTGYSINKLDKILLETTNVHLGEGGNE